MNPRRTNHTDLLLLNNIPIRVPPSRRCFTPNHETPPPNNLLYHLVVVGVSFDYPEVRINIAASTCCAINEQQNALLSSATLLQPLLVAPLRAMEKSQDASYFLKSHHRHRHHHPHHHLGSPPPHNNSEATCAALLQIARQTHNNTAAMRMPYSNSNAGTNPGHVKSEQKTQLLIYSWNIR